MYLPAKKPAEEHKNPREMQPSGNHSFRGDLAGWPASTSLQSSVIVEYMKSLPHRRKSIVAKKPAFTSETNVLYVGGVARLTQREKNSNNERVEEVVINWGKHFSASALAAWKTTSRVTFVWLENQLPVS